MMDWWQVVSIASVVSVVGFVLFVAAYVRRMRNLQGDVLTVKRIRHAASASGEGGDTDLFKILRFMDLDEERTAALAWLEKEALISPMEYFSSLHIPGSFSWPRAIHTLLVKAGFPFFLPVADAVVPAAGQERPAGDSDPLSVIGGSGMVYTILRNGLSPLHLYAVGEMMNLVTARLPLVGEPCMTLFMQGKPSNDLEHLPNPFIFSEHLGPLVEGLDPNAEAEYVGDGKPVAECFPDMVDAHVGCQQKANAYTGRCSDILAMLMNRLASNSMPGGWRPEGKHEKMQVRMTRDGPLLTTTEALLEALVQGDGADVALKICTRVTSFGAALAVKEDDGYRQLPLCVPVRTGIVLFDGVAESSNSSEVMSLMTHAEVALRGCVPGVVSFRVNWYLGIEGFTGWHPGGEVKQPWNNSEDVELVHSKWNDSSSMKQACQATSCIAAVMNKAADRLNLPCGGYGYLGVCNDSIAMVQAALGEPVSMFPCMLAGQTKTFMASLYREYGIEAADRGDAEMAYMSSAVRQGLMRTPCDVVHESSTMMDAIRRVDAGIPRKSPFAMLALTLRDLNRARKQLLESGALYNQGSAEVTGQAQQ